MQYMTKYRITLFSKSLQKWLLANSNINSYIKKTKIVIEQKEPILILEHFLSQNYLQYYNTCRGNFIYESQKKCQVVFVIHCFHPSTFRDKI